MGLIIKRKVQEGVYWVEIPEADLRILCGCPADSIKHLAIKGLLPVVEMGGVQVEYGPNAILLSDVLLQNGDLSNLAEFPILHMFYTQGMILPDHPNFKSPKPLIIGKKDQIKAQLEYLYRGNYGLVSEKEFLDAGESEEFADENLRMKLRFSQGEFTHPDKQMKSVILEEKPVVLRLGVTINRLSENVFEISYKSRKIQIDLNLRKYRKYQLPYSLPKIKLLNHYFSVIHSGEGDGWNQKQPCISSIVQFDGKRYLLDAGPNIVKVLKSFNIKPNQLEGVFFTHVHDDHFAGIYSLLQTHPHLKIFATRIVQATVYKKLAALLSVPEDKMAVQLNFCDLIRDKWNNINGLQVKPIPSAHPVDTTIFIFRAKGKNGYRTYGHYCDIAALKWIRKMIVDSPKEIGISKDYFQSVKKMLNIKLDLKKIDIGGPAIHGDVEDFSTDKTTRIVLSHTHREYSARELKIGNQVEFGQVEVLIEKHP